MLTQKIELHSGFAIVLVRISYAKVIDYNNIIHQKTKYIKQR